MKKTCDGKGTETVVCIFRGEADECLKKSNKIPYDYGTCFHQTCLEVPRFPNITVDLSKADYTFGAESKVHGQMKSRDMDKSIRREFTAEIQQARTWAEQVEICRRWVKVVGV